MGLHKKQVTYSEHPTYAARVAHSRGESQFKTYDTSYIRPKKSKWPTILAIVLAVAVVAILAFIFIPRDQAELLPADQQVEIVIEQGQDARSIGDALAEAGVISSSSEFVQRVNTLGAASSLRAGTFTISGGLSLDDVINVLLSGGLPTGTPLTIPEGYTVAQTAQTVEQVSGGKVTAADFEAAASNAEGYAEAFPFVQGAYDNSLEGFLYPATYYLADDVTADSIVRMMLSQYRDATAAVDFTSMNDAGYSNYQVLIVASLIEKEALLDEERPVIASVIYNRLREVIELQIDATTAYLYGPDFTPEQLHEPGPYNTYDQYGLPAGPICSPGLASIQAAANPETTDYLFYIANGDGSHSFSTTYEEHLNNIG